MKGRRLGQRLQRDGAAAVFSETWASMRYRIHLAAKRTYLDSIQDNGFFEKPLNPQSQPSENRRFWRKGVGNTGLALLQRIAERNTASFFFDGSGPEDLAVAWRTCAPQSEIDTCIQTADAFASGDFSRLVPDAHLQMDPPCWRATLNGDTEWPLGHPGHYASLEREGSLPGDPRSIWEVNRWQFSAIFGGAYLASKEEKYPTVFRSWLESWWEQNPYGSGIHWIHAQEVALRANALTWAWHLMGSSPSWDDTFRLRLLETIALSARFVSRTWSDSPVTHNHLVTESCALVCIAIAFPEFSGAEAWRRQALRVAAREAEKQVLPDGVHGELAPGYHFFVLESFLQLKFLLEKSGRKTPPPILNAISRMVSFSESILDGEGLEWRIGDADDAHAFRLPGSASRNRRGLIDLVHKIRDGHSSVAVDCSYSPELFWLAGIREFSPSKLKSEPAQELRIFEDGGFACFEKDGTRLVFRYGATNLLKGVSVSHQHADLLSVCLESGGVHVLEDPAVYRYSPDMGERVAVRRTRAHNAPMLDGRDTFEVDRLRFGVGAVPVARLLAADFDGTLVYLAAEHDGYLPEAVVRREVILSPGCFVVFIDSADVKDNQAHALQSNWLTGLKVTGIGNDWKLGEAAGASIRFLYPANQVIGNSHGIDQGAWISPRYGRRVPATRLSNQTTSESPSLVTVFLLNSALDARAIKLEGSPSHGCLTIDGIEMDLPASFKGTVS